MPKTVCSTCGGEWALPSGWVGHLATCSPARKAQVIAAVQGLTAALPLVIQTQAGEHREHGYGSTPG